MSQNLSSAAVMIGDLRVKEGLRNDVVHLDRSQERQDVKHADNWNTF